MTTMVIGCLFLAVLVIGWLVGRQEANKHRWHAEVNNARSEDLRELLRERGADHAQMVQALRDEHASSIATMAAMMDKLGEQVRLSVQTAVHGSEPKEAVHVPARADAEARVVRRIREDTIMAGVKAIQEDYKARGLEISDEEARAQALAFLEMDFEAIGRIGAR